MARVVEVSKKTLVARRDELLRKLGMPEKELAERAATGSMTAEEWDAWEELRNIAFLLGDD